MLFRQATPRRASGLSRLKLLTAGNAAAHVKHQLPERHAHGHFHQAGIVNVPGHSKHFRAFALLCADTGIPLRAM